MGLRLLPGIYSGALGLMAAGAMILWPAQLWIGYGLFAAAGGLLLWGTRTKEGRHLWNALWLHRTVYWRFARSPVSQAQPPVDSPSLPPEEPVPSEPDMGLKELIIRAYDRFGPEPKDSEKRRALQERIDRELIDLVKFKRLHVWGRYGKLGRDPLKRSTLDKAYFKHTQLKLCVVGFDGTMEFSDIGFLRSEVDQHWPPRDMAATNLDEKRRVIEEGRKAVIAFGDSGEDARRYLERQPAFVRLRKYLSEGYIQKFNSAAYSFEISGGKVQHSLITGLARELDRLETEWGLDLGK